MLDGKILSAVLATLTAVAVSTSGGGDLSDQGIETNPSNMEIDVGGLLKNPVEQLREMATTTPTPSNSVYAELQAQNIQNESFQVNDARIAPDNATEIGFGSQTVSSDQVIELHGYTGSIMPSNSSVVLSGNANSLISSGVNVSGTSAIEHSIESSSINVYDVKESSVALSQVTGSIESSGASTEFGSSRPLTIDSFSGDITMRPRNGTIILDGEVNSLTAGDFQFGE